MVRLGIMSDLHLELDRKHAPVDLFRISSPDSRVAVACGPSLDGLAGAVDLVLLAGDVDARTKGLNYASLMAGYLGVPVLYVAGNHEFYGSHIGLSMELQRLASESDGVFFLENSKAEFEVRERRVLVLGTTLWTDFELFGAQHCAECMHAAQEAMTDYQVIRSNPPTRLLMPIDTVGLHHESRGWLQQQLSQVDSDTTAIVLTHHAPSLRSISPAERTEPISAAYASNLESLIEQCGPALWIHGHTHCRADYILHRTRVFSNPFGYPHDRVSDNPLILSV